MASPWPAGPVEHAGDLVTVDEHMGDLQVAVREPGSPRPERSLGKPAVSRDQVGGKDVVREEPRAFSVEVRCGLVEASTGPWRRRRVVQHPYGGTRRRPRRRRRGRRLPEAAERRPREGAEREHGRLAPQDFRSRDRRHPHRLDLDVGPRLVSVDLQEHLADAERRAVVVGDDDLDLIHVGHCSGRATMSPPVCRVRTRERLPRRLVGLGVG